MLVCGSGCGRGYVLGCVFVGVWCIVGWLVWRVGCSRCIAGRGDGYRACRSFDVLFYLAVLL